MPTNRIVVEWTEATGYKCRAWDAQGQETDVTDVFVSIRGGTGEGRVWSEIRCGKDSVISKIEFKALAKELIVDVPPEVVSQILQLHNG